MYNQDLSSLILDPNSGYDNVHIQYALSRMVNGYEQIFVMGAQVPTIQAVPEPASVALWALLGGFGSIIAARRRKVA
jgi:hypothetical protein